jgi:protein SCO1/2
MKKAHLLIIAVMALSTGFIVSWMLNDSKPVKLEAGLWFGDQAKILPDFRLLDHNNQTLGKSELTGKWSLMFFGYTHCPDICPTSLQTLSDMLNAIDDIDVRRKVQVIFVSVDPDRDTPAILKTYVQYFHPDLIGASASVPELNRLTGVIGIAHSRDKNIENQSVYGVSHSSAIALLNPEVEFAGLFRAPHDGLAMARDLVKIIERN